MLNLSNPNSEFAQSFDQHQKLSQFAQENRKTIWPTNHKISFNAMTARGVDIAFTNLPGNKDLAGTLFKIGVATEILNIPLEEPKARCIALADAYVLAKQQKKYQMKVVKTYGSIIVPVSAISVGASIPIAITSPAVLPFTLSPLVISIPLYYGTYLACKANKDVKEIKELTQCLLQQNNVDISKYLEKVKYSKMDLQKSRCSELGPMRQGQFHVKRHLFVPKYRKDLQIACMPVNTQKTRQHLSDIFGGSENLINRLNRIINDADNFSECPYAGNTEGGRFSVAGWRKILELCVVEAPIVNQSQPVAAVNPARASSSTTTTVTINSQQPPPSYESIMRSCDQITESPHHQQGRQHIVNRRIFVLQIEQPSPVLI